jgi:hypothetical protein
MGRSLTLLHQKHSWRPFLLHPIIQRGLPSVGAWRAKTLMRKSVIRSSLSSFFFLLKVCLRPFNWKKFKSLLQNYFLVSRKIRNPYPGCVASVASISSVKTSGSSQWRGNSSLEGWHVSEDSVRTTFRNAISYKLLLLSFSADVYTVWFYCTGCEMWHQACSRLLEIWQTSC